MKTILVPLDGSELAAQVLPYVRTLAANLSANICLLNVVADVPHKPFRDQHHMMLWSTSEELLRESTADEGIFAVLRQRAISYLDQFARVLRQDGFDVETEVLFEQAAEGIVKVAEERHVDLIAMVTHGYSGLRRWALGSTTDKVVSMASAPVFVVRGSEHPVLAEPPVFKRILVPLDGSDFSRQSLPVAAELATHMQANVHVLHAMLSVEEYPALVRASVTGPQFADAMNRTQEWAQEHLAAAAAALQHTGCTVTTHVAKGYPAEMIIEEATRQQSDVIVMATHGYSGLKRWTLGSIADKVLHATSTPLVLVHARE